MLNNKKFLVLFLLLFALLSIGVIAHDGGETNNKNLEAQYARNSLNIIYISSIIIGLFVLLSIFYQKQLKNYKVLLFLGIIIPSIMASLFLATSTIHLNFISETKGPVHWHADFEIYGCGQEVDILDPTGLSNRIGTPVFHEHNDNRVHVEGVVVKYEEVDLHSFFEVLGGYLNQESFGLPTDNGFVQFNNGDLCNGRPGELQVFLYRITNPDAGRKSGFQYEQVKLDNFEDYVLSPYSNVPPGDCVIIEFIDQDKQKTDNICETYKVAIQRGDIFGS